MQTHNLPSEKKDTSLRERHLQALWFEQRYFSSLFLSTGEPVDILSPGIWNEEEGPDFLKGHIKINGKLIRGDIEIHFFPKDWEHHGHEKDPQYDNVILHVCLEPSKKEIQTQNSQGDSIPIVYLRDSLKVKIEQAPKLLDLDLYPYAEFRTPGKCSSLLFSQLSEKEIYSLFSKAALWRLSRKARFLKHRILNPLDHITAGIAMGLGYKKNSESFLKIFSFLKQFHRLPEEDLFSIALGCSGFFNEKYQKKWEESSNYLLLKKLWIGYESKITERFKLHLGYIRPLNHPVRRLAYLTKVIKDRKNEYILHTILEKWTQRWPQLKTTKDLKKFYTTLLAVFPDYKDPYWNSHYTFETIPQTQLLSLIGESLKREIILNTFLPLLFAKIPKNLPSDQFQTFLRFYSSLTLQPTGKLKYLKKRFFLSTDHQKLINNSILAQGAYQIHYDFCQHYEASCLNCNFCNIHKTNA